MNDVFLQDIIYGLSQSSKTIPSKYFYDANGDALFVKIMSLPEYYLTRAEMDIFQHKTAELFSALYVSADLEYDIIELGAGDGTKTIHLLRELLERTIKFNYLPIDISANALQDLKQMLLRELPSLHINGIQNDYFQALETLKGYHKPKIVLFLGSNIGNLLDEEAHDFLKALDQQLKQGDRVILGVDLIKSAKIILPAYNDAEGVTSAFNLNLLTRINTELDADFDLNEFEHAPEYEAEHGIAKSYLKSKIKQVVYIGKANQSFSFNKGELIQTEVSRKYDDSVVMKLLEETNLEIETKILDHNNLFADFVLGKRSK